MAPLICKSCGSNSLTEEGNFYVCDFCGTRTPKSDFGVRSAASSQTPVINFGAGAKGKNVDRLLQKADLFKSAGNIVKAKDLYSQVLEIDPNNERALAALK